MPTLDAIGLVAADLPATLAFYRLLGLDMDAVEELYEETSKKEAQEEPLPRFGRALASNTGRIQGMFVPDNQANY